MLTSEEFEEIKKSNEQFKKAEQIRMLIWAGFVAFLIYVGWLISLFFSK
jgi:hypothetical protein